MRIEFSRDFSKRFDKRFSKYTFEVGVLKDAQYKKPQRGKGNTTTFAGGPVRKKSRENSGKSIAEVGKDLRKRTGVNYLTEPLRNKSNTDILRFTKELFKGVFGKMNDRRIINLLQAIVRNPILRGDYGPNSRLTQRIKGFDRAMIDTGQLFKAIKARIVRK